MIGLQHKKLIHAALQDRTGGIVASFFSVFYAKWEGSITKDDGTILKALRQELDALVRERNRIMHDAWMVSGRQSGSPAKPAARLRVRAHGSGVEHVLTHHTPEQIEDLAETSERLSENINGTTWYMRPGQVGPEIAPRFEIRNKKVYRRDAPSSLEREIGTDS